MHTQFSKFVTIAILFLNCWGETVLFHCLVTCVRQVLFVVYHVTIFSVFNTWSSKKVDRRKSWSPKKVERRKKLIVEKVDHRKKLSVKKSWSSKKDSAQTRQDLNLKVLWTKVIASSNISTSADISDCCAMSSSLYRSSLRLASFSWRYRHW